MFIQKCFEALLNLFSKLGSADHMWQGTVFFSNGAVGKILLWDFRKQMSKKTRCMTEHRRANMAYFYYNRVRDCNQRGY